jgi:hypothetical protein
VNLGGAILGTLDCLCNKYSCCDDIACSGGITWVRHTLWDDIHGQPGRTTARECGEGADGDVCHLAIEVLCVCM